MIKIFKKIFFNQLQCNYYIKNDSSIVYPEARIFNFQKKAEKIKILDFTHIRGELLVFPQSGTLTIGSYCYIGENTRVWTAKNIMIGDRVLISHGVNIFDNDTHPIDSAVLRHKQFKDIITTGHPVEIDLKGEDVIIEDDVLICANVTILKGVRIGKCAVVGAGSVVTKNVPSNTLVVGNPAKVVRSFPQENLK